MAAPKVAQTARAIVSCVQPAVYSLAGRLFVLTAGRRGSRLYMPTVATFYETSIVTALYETLLMLPDLVRLEIRHEMPYPPPKPAARKAATKKPAKRKGAPKKVDLWMRPPKGGYPHLIEAGDFSVGKVHRDCRKITALNPNGSNWFLAFFREPSEASDPWAVLQASLARKNGLNGARVHVDRRLVGSFLVYRPDGASDPFGYALLRAV